MRENTVQKPSDQQFFKQKPYNDNFNKMFYQEFTQKKHLNSLYQQAYEELFKISQALSKTKEHLDVLGKNQKDKSQKEKGVHNSETTPNSKQNQNNEVQNELRVHNPQISMINNKTQTEKESMIKQNQKDKIRIQEGIHNPETSMRIKKFKSLFFEESDKKKWENYSNESKKLQQLYIFQKQQTRDMFSKLIEIFNKKFKEGDKFESMVFETILKSLATQVKYTVYLPSTVKVILAGINWIDKENSIASIALKIEIKVHIPGFNNYPNIYLQMMKEKFKFSLKTQSNSYLRNRKINIKQSKQKEKSTQICKGNDIFDDKISKKIQGNPSKYFKDRYKWKNYYTSDDFVLKKLNGFEGCIIQACADDVKVLIETVDQSSLLQLLDLKGFVQIQPITTEMNEWSSILFNQEESQFRRLLEQVSPQVSIKFNLISFYEDQKKIDPSKKLLINQIYSFNEMEKDDYHLASRLMFLEMTNSRKSNYKLKRSFRSYGWSRLPDEELKTIQKLNYLHKKSFSQDFLRNLKQQQKKIEVFIKFFNLNKIQNQKSGNIQEHLKYLKKYLIDIGSGQLNDQIDGLQYQLKNLQILEGYLSDLQITTKRKVVKNQKNLSQHMQEQKKKQINRERQTKKDKEDNNKKRKEEYEKQIDIEKKIERQEFTSYEIKKLRLQIKKIAQYYIERLVFEKQKQVAIKGSPQQIKQLEQIKKYISAQVMDKQYEYSQAQKKYDDDYSQSKAIFHFPIYKPPGQNLVIFFFSIFLVSAINLAIFFQEPSLAGRVASIATLMLFFISMTASIQKQIGSFRIQQLFYLLFFTPFICLVHSYLLPPGIQDKQITQHALYSYAFIFCAGVTGISFLYISYQYSLFLLIQKSQYNINLRIMKQTQALYVLFPGSQQIDKVLHLKNYNKIKAQQRSKQQKKLKVKKLHRILITIMMRHINNLYEIQSQTKKNQLEEFRKKFKKRIEDTKKIVQKMFESPIKKVKKEEQKN